MFSQAHLGSYETLYSYLSYHRFHGHVMPFRADTAEAVVRAASRYGFLRMAESVQISTLGRLFVAYSYLRYHRFHGPVMPFRAEAADQIESVSKAP